MSEPADIATSSADYAARFSGAAGAWMLKCQEQLAREALKSAGVRTVLDVGGGHGQLARPLADAGFEVTVLGSDPVCARRLEDDLRAGRFHFIAGSVLDPPFPDRSFDAVVSVRLLPHCEAWEGLLASFCRLARGTVVVDYPTPSKLGPLAPWLFRIKKGFEKNTRAWIAFRHADVASVLHAHGFRVRRRTGQFAWPMALHRALNNARLSAWLERPPRALGWTARQGSPVLLHAERRPEG